MSDLIDREQALSLPMANGKYDHENADPHFINGLETYREWIKRQPIIELTLCKDCKYFQKNHWEKVNGFPTIVAHEICTRWGGGCKTDINGYCFMAERRENE